MQYVTKSLVKVALAYGFRVEAERANGVQTGRLHFKMINTDVRGTMSVKNFVEQVLV